MNTEAEQIIHVVDDDPPFLAAIGRALEVLGLPVRQYPRARQCMEALDPDQGGCLITDLRMPDLDGLGFQQWLNERHCSLPVIFITGHGDTDTAVKALKRGALDFLRKPFREEDLLACVRKALRLERENRQRARDEREARRRFAELTPREQEVLQLVVAGCANKVIARHLMISPRTVEHHRKHVMLKMQARSTSDLLTLAVLCGVYRLSLDDDRGEYLGD
ncbi:MAG: response regulator [Alcanivorax sp.]|uniref:response regulator transcription factor n=1 Tax=Alloalcanivorax marinus TaxID=1177169 RepID=UPI00195C3956|nr:response regulator [Alloalcanivorax marinus]MBM7334430.1 response regulator transcription factor [Alloalcanivorax marinus]